MTRDEYAMWLDNLSPESLYAECLKVIRANVGRSQRTQAYYECSLECGRRQPDGPALWRRAEEAVRRESDPRRAGNEEALRRRLGGGAT